MLDEVTTSLEKAGVVFARREAEWMIESVTGFGRDRLATGQVDVDVDAAQRVIELAWRRAAGEPLQYVLEVAAFRRLELSVGPGVFIPRPETELVAGRAMDRLPPGGTVVDVGTGSGAIALSIAYERPDVRVFATEVSRAALSWAEKNRARLGLPATFVRGDLFEGLPREFTGAVDVVVSNPPYVPERERAYLPVDVAHHEPAVALYGDHDGLAVIRRLAADATNWITTGGYLVIEVGDRQGAEVSSILAASGYREIRVMQDLAARDRIVEARA